MALNFTRGLESASAGKVLQPGEIRFTTNGNYGKIWYYDSQGNTVNIIPHLVDCGDWPSNVIATNPIIKIKRNNAVGATLSDGELGFNTSNHGLYIGTNNENVLINLTNKEQTIEGKKIFANGIEILAGGITTNGSIVPKANSTDSLGVTGTRWKNLFVDDITATNTVTATEFHGALVGNASSASKLNTDAGSQSLPVYFKNGIPVSCVNTELFSDFSKSTTGTTITLSATVAGNTLTASLGAATSSAAGLMTNAAQTLSGNKTFSNNLTVTGTTTMNGKIFIKSGTSASYGTTLPSSGTEGQVFFLLID